MMWWTTMAAVTSMYVARSALSSLCIAPSSTYNTNTIVGSKCCTHGCGGGPTCKSRLVNILMALVHSSALHMLEMIPSVCNYVSIAALYASGRRVLQRPIYAKISRDPQKTITNPPKKLNLCDESTSSIRESII